MGSTMWGMSLRQVVWTATFLIVTIPLAYIGLVAYTDSQIQARTDAHQAAREEWRSAIRSERSRALGKLEQIRAELASGNMPEWAGEYSWTGRTMWSSCGMSEPWCYGEGLAIAPQGGAMWWIGLPDVDSAWALDYGPVVAVDDQHIVVEWTINPKHAHVFDLAGSTFLLSDELVRVRWDDGDFLVPATRMPSFCSEWVGGGDEPDLFAPKRGGWRVGPESPDPDFIRYGRRPPPVVPQRWRAYVMPVPVTARAWLEDPPDLVRRWDVRVEDDLPPLWNRVIDRRAMRNRCIVRSRYCMSAGTDQGLLVGMPITFDEGFGYPRGVVVAASPMMAHVEFFGVGLDIPNGEHPYEATMLTTGVPVPSWTR